MAVAVIIILVMTVGMPVTVIFVVPMTFCVSPAISMTVIVGARPVRARVRRLVIVPGNPTVVMALGRPESANPNHAYNWGWWRWGLDTNWWWWRDTNDDGNLSRCRHREGGSQEERNYPLTCHAGLR